jgi:hypothetical protein
MPKFFGAMLWARHYDIFDDAQKVFAGIASHLPTSKEDQSSSAYMGLAK